MVSLAEVTASNAQIPKSLPPHLVAVFAGATTGIGQATLKTFVKYAVKPRIYFLARNTDSAEKVAAECKETNPDAEFIILKVNLRSMQETEQTCKEIARNEKAVNLVFLSAGEVLLDGSVTPEGLHTFIAAAYYSKILIIQNLLPLLKYASNTSPLARVVVVLAGTKEGDIVKDDLPAFKLSLFRMRGHITSMATLALENLAKQAPTVSFVHDYPGSVPSPLVDDVPGFAGLLLRILAYIPINYLARWLMIAPAESGERHVHFATSGRYPPKEGMAVGLALDDPEKLSKGSDESVGSGIYILNWDGEGPTKSAASALKRLRESGTEELVWTHTVESLERAKAAVVNRAQ